MFSNSVQPENAPSSNLVIAFDIFTSVKFLHPAKAELPILPLASLFILFVIFNFVIPLSQNALFSITLILSGKFASIGPTQL